jgi:hypothetical protein
MKLTALYVVDAFLAGERAARLYSETARKTVSRKSNTIVVIVSFCAASIPATISTSF